MLGHDPQHSGISPVASQSLQTIHWQTPVDLAPQYSGNDLFIHYGSPLITPANTVIVPVKTGAGGFRVDAFNGGSGAPLWSQITDYQLPPSPGWTPSYAPALAPTGRLHLAGNGGTVYYIDSPDSTGASITGQFAFYGLANYLANPGAYNSQVFINTPLTVDSSGNVYFGFQVTGANPSNLQSGIARIAPDGTGISISATAASGDATMSKVVDNCAPALSTDGSTLYIAVNNGNSGVFNNGYLLALNSMTLAMTARVLLKDPSTGNLALLPDDGTASPTVGPNGDVFFGVLENPFPHNNDRGWLLHFDANLATALTPGAFGWDDTAAIVPASMVPSYSGSSTYLLMTKFNNYQGVGSGNGINKLAILDPAATMVDPVTGSIVMKEVLTIAGVTPDPTLPAVREWCINSAAIDPATKSVLANSEDGKLYRWDLVSNTFTEQVTLTAGVGEAYTPTLIGVDGTVYAINNATLFAIGNTLPPAAVSGFVINPGDTTGQRSMVTTVQVNFTRHVDTFDAGAFELMGGAGVSLIQSAMDVGGMTQVLLTFSGSPIIGHSLADGNYTLTVHKEKVHAGGATMSADGVDSFFRLFGDTNGDRKVDNTDYTIMRAVLAHNHAYDAYLFALDYNGDGVVDMATDYYQFRKRLGMTLAP